ncbi:hypothetical protein BB559_000613 [Furculomyces boomerangus]|uniref:MICOS complex subunit n=2 Tax=Harpellales TaxID=61421 RepID=A0A2T9Z4R7_9FUNG|nr:hypothetical protein BB559_000613 [Furculomyces boomerangus]PVZ99579.1 hypothetical protein BB558_004391 [Smittium angustum]
MSISASIKAVGMITAGAAIFINRTPLQCSDNNYEKKSVYSEEKVQPKKDEKPIRLMSYVGTVRKQVQEKYKESMEFAHKTVDEWISIENKVIETVKSVKSKDEEMLPGLLYISISTLAAPIFFRKSNFVFRYTAPLVFGIVSTSIVLPKTFGNIVEKLNGSSQGFNTVTTTMSDLKKETFEVKSKLDNSLEARIQKIRKYIFEK